MLVSRRVKNLKTNPSRGRLCSAELVRDFYLRMAKDPSFPFYAQDYLVDTIRWTRGMQGLHVSLLAESWANGALADDGGKPAGLVGTDVELWFAIKHKWQIVDKMWTNEKLEGVRAERESFREKQRQKGILSGKSRNSGSTKSEPDTQPKTNRGSTVVEPIEGEGESEKDNKNKKEPDFEKPDIDGEVLIFPFDTPAMRKLWAGWKRYRWNAYKARYPMMGEQADLQRLQGMTYPEIEKAILEAIAKNWKHIYPEHGKQQTISGFSGKPRKESSDDLKRAFAERHGAKPPSGQV